MTPGRLGGRIVTPERPEGQTPRWLHTGCGPEGGWRGVGCGAPAGEPCRDDCPAPASNCDCPTHRPDSQASLPLTGSPL